MTPQIEKPIDLYAPGAIEALIAYHHAQFGDARMEGTDDKSQEGEGTDKKDDDGKGESDKPDDKDDKGSDDGKDDKDDKRSKPEDDLPEWARNELKNVRGEAANWRTKFRELETKLKDAKTPEDFEAATKEYAEKITSLEHDILRIKVGREFDLPDEFAELLKGETEEDLKKHAKSLQKFVATGTKSKNLKGGLNPDEGDDDTSDDPRELRKLAHR